MIDFDALWRLKDSLVQPQTKQTRFSATYSHTDQNGIPWVKVAGSEELSPVTGSLSATMEQGQTVELETRDGTLYVAGNSSDPSQSSNAARAAQRVLNEGIRAAKVAAAMADNVAKQAKRVADAIDQHFWTDGSGVHVTEAEQEGFKASPTGRNILMNAYGILLREGENWLSSFTEGATAFYDGLGNEAANIVAQFGADGATIGRATAGRLVLSSDGLAQFTDDGVMGIMAGLSSTNHTLDVTHPEQKLRIGEAYWYKMYDRSEYKRSSPSADWPFWDSSPTTGVSKFLLSLRLDGFQDGAIVGNVRYDLAVPFASDYAFNVPGTTFYVRWNATNQALLVEKMTPDQQDSHGVYSTLRVTYTGYVTVESAKSPVLLFGEHTGASAPGLYAVALGRESTSEGDNTLTAGIATGAASEAQTAIGKYNDNDPDNAFEVGNGTADDARSNAFAVGWDGTIETARDRDTTTWTDVLSSKSSDVNITGFKLVQRGQVVSLWIRFQRTTATSAGAAITVGTLSTAYRPLVEAAAPATTGAGDAYVLESGSVMYRPQSQLAANTNAYVRVTYLVA